MTVPSQAPTLSACDERNDAHTLPAPAPVFTACSCRCLAHSQAQAQYRSQPDLQLQSRPRPQADPQPQVPFPSPLISLCKSRVRVFNFVHHGVLKDCPASFGKSARKADGSVSDEEGPICSEKSEAALRTRHKKQHNANESESDASTDSDSESSVSAIESNAVLRGSQSELITPDLSSPTTRTSISTTKSLTRLLSSPSPMKGVVSTASGSIEYSSRMPSIQLAFPQSKQTRSARLKSPYGQQEEPRGAHPRMPCSKRASRQVLRTLQLLHRQAEDQNRAAVEAMRAGRPRSSL
jgi:hypothetical protein